MSSDQTIAIKAFWTWFKNNSGKLQAIRSAEDSAYEQLNDQISALGPGVCVEVGGAGDAHTLSLILTAYGVASLFPLIDAIVAAAPKIPGWKIFALKPPLLEELEIDYEGAVVRVSDLWVLLGDAPLGGTLPIEIAINGTFPMDEDDENREAAALLALESFIGERAFASEIRVVGFIPLPAQPLASGFVRAGDLAGRLGLHRIQ